VFALPPVTLALPPTPRPPVPSLPTTPTSQPFAPSWTGASNKTPYSQCELRMYLVGLMNLMMGPLSKQVALTQNVDYRSPMLNGSLHMMALGLAQLLARALTLTSQLALWKARLVLVEVRGSARQVTLT